MSYEYGDRSKRKLATCHPMLKTIAQDVLVVSPYDISIIHGFRGEQLQNDLYDNNKSTKIWPDSKHNNTENGKPYSLALDFAPWVGSDINWNDTHIFACIAGCFFVVACDRGVRIRWGGDWDSDGSTKDQGLMDWGHIEIIL